MKHTILALALCCSTIAVYAQTETDSLSDNVNLDEVVVTARRPTTKFTDTDFTLPHSWSLGTQLILNRMFNYP